MGKKKDSFKEQYEDSVKRAKEIRKKMIKEIHCDDEESVEAQSYTDIKIRSLTNRIYRLIELYKEIEREISSIKEDLDKTSEDLKEQSTDIKIRNLTNQIEGLTELYKGIKEDIYHIKNELAEMQKPNEEAVKEEVKIEPPNKRWRAKEGEPYWYLTADEVYRDVERATNIDSSRYTLGNYFRTKEEAEFEYERLKVVNELCEWVTPYRSKGLYAFYLHMSDTAKRFKISIVENSIPPQDFLYFESEKIAKNAIKAVGEDRILKYYYRLNIDEEN